MLSKLVSYSGLVGILGGLFLSIFGPSSPVVSVIEIARATSCLG